MSINIATICAGDKVCYQPAHYGKIYENGIVKEIRNTNSSAVWVVFHCNGEWENYNEYTGALTAVADLSLGWKHESTT